MIKVYNFNLVVPASWQAAAKINEDQKVLKRFSVNCWQWGKFKTT